MNHLLRRFVCFCGFGAASLAAATIQYQVTPLASPGLYRYSYSASGVSFQTNQELDILFPVASYSSLMNGTAPAGFLLNLFQPNNPPGVQGDYSALATTNNPPLTGFAVDTKYIGAGQPGSQPYQINQFDANGNFISTISSGVTTPATVGNVPEPATESLLLIGLGAGASLGLVRRRRSARPV